SCLNRAELTCIDTCLTNTVLAVLRHCIAGDRTVLTCGADDLDHIAVILKPRSLSLCQTDTLSDDLSLLVNTAAELSSRSRDQFHRDLILTLLQLSGESQPRYFL